MIITGVQLNSQNVHKTIISIAHFRQFNIDKKIIHKNRSDTLKLLSISYILDKFILHSI